jgi:5'-3' exonuclease
MADFVLDKNSPIILVDGSYFIFHRFFATLKWYKFKNKEMDDSSCMKNEEFCNAIKKHAIADLEKLRKKWATVHTGKKRLSKKDWENIPIWFAMDCCRGDIWRSSLITDYKGTRDIGRSFDPSCFEILYEIIRKEVPVFEGSKLEADDIIALTHKRLRMIGYNGLIVCVTNDNDYLQLRDENTQLYNLDGKDIGLRSCGDPKKDLLLKILLGDKSDNIAPVRKKLNEKKLKELIHLTEEDIINSLCLNEDEVKEMKLNRKLIDFSYIPMDLEEAYNSTYDIEMK